jgi:hypothetical protein
MIGTLGALSVPFWLGANRIAELTLGNVRHLDPGWEGPQAARVLAEPAPLAPVAPRRNPFTVYEGGRR